MLVKRLVVNLVEETEEVVGIVLTIDEKVVVFHRRRHRLQPALTILLKPIFDQRDVWMFASGPLIEPGIGSYPLIPFDNPAVSLVT
jgi:hypothetical protein